ncbi:MAG: hypothetical protein QOE70_291 [Chthoniobacter sp.]|jgi:hypothetical protein|nr:hypothetical protein [Chthoniobacter sp.]
MLTFRQKDPPPDRVFGQTFCSEIDIEGTASTVMWKDRTDAGADGGKFVLHLVDVRRGRSTIPHPV